MKLIQSQDQDFNSCQKIKIHTVMKSGNHKEEFAQKGEMDIFLDQNHVSRLNVGDTIDMCAYFSAEPSIIRMAGEDITLEVNRSAFMVCYYPAAKRTSLNSTFFSSLSLLSCEYIHCPDVRNQQTICYNFNKMIETINLIKFPYLEPNNFSTLKLIVLNSLFNQLYFHPLHLMVITEEVAFIRKAVQLEGISIQQWPSLYDQSTMVTFLAQCHHSIVLVSNPSKKDMEVVNSILNESSLKNLNCTLWIISEPNQDFKKDLNIEKIDIIIDLSSTKNINICKDMFDDLIDNKLEGFIDKNSQIITTAIKQRRDQDFYEGYQSSFEGI